MAKVIERVREKFACRDCEASGGHILLVEICRLNEVDPYAWLTDILAKLPDHSAHRVAELLPWAWKSYRTETHIAAAV